MQFTDPVTRVNFEARSRMLKIVRVIIIEYSKCQVLEQFHKTLLQQ